MSSRERAGARAHGFALGSRRVLALGAVLAAWSLLAVPAARAAAGEGASGAGEGRVPAGAAAPLKAAIPQPGSAAVAAEPARGVARPAGPSEIRPSDTSTGLFLTGNVSASWGSSGIDVKVDHVVNNRGSGTSGTLRLELWATTTAPVFGSTISFFALGPAFILGTLDAGFEFNNVDTGLLSPFTPPPSGCYFVTVALEEFDGSHYDYVDLRTFSSGGVADPGGSGFDLFGFGVSNGSCASTAGCVANATTLCIDQNPGDGRFEIQVSFHTSQGGGHSGSGHAIRLSSLGVTEGGLFWFFGGSNPEMLIKLIDGCSLTSHFWVFFAATTNVGFTVTVTDTQTAHQAIYTNADKHAAPPVQDTSALSCP
jgi:hypothetical protein